MPFFFPPIAATIISVLATLQYLISSHTSSPSSIPPFSSDEQVNDDRIVKLLCHTEKQIVFSASTNDADQANIDGG